MKSWFLKIKERNKQNLYKIENKNKRVTIHAMRHNGISIIFFCFGGCDIHMDCKLQNIYPANCQMDA